MKKKIFGGVAILVIAAIAVFNVNLSKQSNGLSNVMLANVEALAEESTGGDQNGWDEEKQSTTSSMNGVEYKKSEIINCYKGGPNSSCTPGCKYQVKNSDGTWTSWMPC